VTQRLADGQGLVGSCTSLNALREAHVLRWPRSGEKMRDAPRIACRRTLPMDGKHSTVTNAASGSSLR
jgi:hypothetical protein